LQGNSRGCLQAKGDELFTGLNFWVGGVTHYNTRGFKSLGRNTGISIALDELARTPSEILLLLSGLLKATITGLLHYISQADERIRWHGGVINVGS